MEALLLRQTIGICCRDLKRRTDFRFLEAHMCVIFITFLTNHGGSTSDGESTAHGDSPCNHTASPADILPISANGRRSLAMASMPVSPSQRPAMQIDIPHWSPHMRKRHASCKPFHNPPDTLARIFRHCDAIHACECSRDGRSMIWHAAAFSHTKIDREHASLGIMVEVGAWTRSPNGDERLHASPDIALNFHIDNNLHDQPACLGGMWPLGQSRLLPTHGSLRVTKTCRPPLTLFPCLPSRHADLSFVLFPPPRRQIQPTLKQLFRKYEACLGWEIASPPLRR
jgi:hypothetical protein